MNPLIAVNDDFFKSLDWVKDLKREDFKDFELGVDNVVYPHICTELPKGVEFEFLYKLERLIFRKVEPQYLFLRAMPEGTVAPSKIHSDRDMGNFTAHVYLSRQTVASTAFFRHVDLGYMAERHMTGSEWTQDPAEWEKYLTVHGKQNRILVHGAAPFHCAEPENGFGTLGIDARLVLTCFFNVS